MTPTSRTSRPDRPGAPCAGFTLLELIIVVLIIASVMGLALPKLGLITGMSADDEARAIAGTLRYVNESSALTRRTYSVTFDLTGKTLSWNDMDSEGNELGIDGLNAVELPSRGMVTDGQLKVLFGPAGLGENLNVYIKTGDRELTVKFNHLSGRAKVL